MLSKNYLLEIALKKNEGSDYQRKSAKISKQIISIYFTWNRWNLFLKNYSNWRGN